EGARAARAALPDAPDLHLWGLDVFGGGWCGCDGCAALTPSDQSLAVCNAAADTVGDDGRIFHLAYHDTLAPPASVRPHPRVWRSSRRANAATRTRSTTPRARR